MLLTNVFGSPEVEGTFDEITIKCQETVGIGEKNACAPFGFRARELSPGCLSCLVKHCHRLQSVVLYSKRAKPLSLLAYRGGIYGMARLLPQESHEYDGHRAANTTDRPTNNDEVPMFLQIMLFEVRTAHRRKKWTKHGTLTTLSYAIPLPYLT